MIPLDVGRSVNEQNQNNITFFLCMTFVLSVTFDLCLTSPEYGTPTLGSFGAEHLPLVDSAMSLICTPDPSGKELTFMTSKYNFYKDGELLLSLYFNVYSL